MVFKSPRLVYYIPLLGSLGYLQQAYRLSNDLAMAPLLRKCFPGKIFSISIAAWGKFERIRYVKQGLLVCVFASKIRLYIAHFPFFSLGMDDGLSPKNCGHCRLYIAIQLYDATLWQIRDSRVKTGHLIRRHCTPGDFLHGHPFGTPGKSWTVGHASCLRFHSKDPSQHMCATISLLLCIRRLGGCSSLRGINYITSNLPFLYLLCVQSAWNRRVA
jgi:hypothetical protein